MVEFKLGSYDFGKGGVHQCLIYNVTSQTSVVTMCTKKHICYCTTPLQFFMLKCISWFQ